MKNNSLFTKKNKYSTTALLFVMVLVVLGGVAMGKTLPRVSADDNIAVSMLSDEGLSYMADGTPVFTLEYMLKNWKDAHIVKDLTRAVSPSEIQDMVKAQQSGSGNTAERHKYICNDGSIHWTDINIGSPITINGSICNIQS